MRKVFSSRPNSFSARTVTLCSPGRSMKPVMNPLAESTSSPGGSPTAAKRSGRAPVAGIACRKGVPVQIPHTPAPLIRGLGPYLAQFFGAGAMADPKLDLYVAGNSSPVTTNDNWGGAAEIAGVAQTVGAQPLTAATSKAAVFLLTLDPGVYSAQVTSANNASGIALVEVYAVP